MMKEKTDIRVHVTRKVLRESLISLMKKKSIMDITIKEICETAGLSRSTFYTYCHNQYDLLRQIEDETFIEVNKVMRPHLSAVRQVHGREANALLQAVLQFIADNSNSIQVLLSENGDHAFQKKFFRKGIEAIRQFANAAGVKPQAQDKGASNYDFVFLVGGTLVLVQEWIKNGMDMPVPELAALLVKITRDALR
jgi:AcrR family transcriptional regulator